MKEATRSWIDKSDSAGHVCQHFLVEDHFALQPLLGLHLALIKPAAQPREDRRESNQPGCQHGHSSQKVMDRFVGHDPRLLHHRHPTGRFDRAERIKITVTFEMSALALADLFHQYAFFPGRRSCGIRLKILRKKRGTILIEHLEEQAIGKLNRG